jgi:hypothetical protein
MSLASTPRPTLTVSLNEVPLWAIGAQRIGHAVASRNQGWTLTVCEQWSPSFHLSSDQPRRICATCRKRLKTARLVLA